MPFQQNIDGSTRSSGNPFKDALQSLGGSFYDAIAGYNELTNDMLGSNNLFEQALGGVMGGVGSITGIYSSKLNTERERDRYLYLFDEIMGVNEGKEYWQTKPKKGPAWATQVIENYDPYQGQQRQQQGLTTGQGNAYDEWYKT